MRVILSELLFKCIYPRLSELCRTSGMDTTNMWGVYLGLCNTNILHNPSLSMMDDYLTNPTGYVMTYWANDFYDMQVSGTLFNSVNYNILYNPMNYRYIADINTPSNTVGVPNFDSWRTADKYSNVNSSYYWKLKRLTAPCMIDYISNVIDDLTHYMEGGEDQSIRSVARYYDNGNIINTTYSYDVLNAGEHANTFYNSSTTYSTQLFKKVVTTLDIVACYRDKDGIYRQYAIATITPDTPVGTEWQWTPQNCYTTHSNGWNNDVQFRCIAKVYPSTDRKSVV